MVEIWTSEAKYTFGENIKLLRRKWSLTEAEKFTEKAFSSIDIILSNPQIGIFDVKWNAYKLLIVSQVYLYYEIKENEIILLSFWNNIQKG